MKENDLESNFISVVVYVHNGETYIEPFICELLRLLEERFSHSEIICVNDFSRDGSSARIRELAGSAHTTSLSILNMGYYHGMELATNAGRDLAIGDFIFEFDRIVQDYNSDLIMQVYCSA